MHASIRRISLSVAILLAVAAYRRARFRGEPQFTEILQAVHRKLGVVVSTAQTSFYTRDEAGTNAGTYISLTYKTEFAQGPATESFNWRVLDGKVHLVSYNIQSSLLITR
jgi:hypothetical protein